nr:hypothetical protein [Tanacetum cinerariifolium]
PTVGQDGSYGSGVGVVIGLSVACGACVGVRSQGSSHIRWTKRRVLGFMLFEVSTVSYKIVSTASTSVSTASIVSTASLYLVFNQNHGIHQEEAHLMKVQWNGANMYQVSGGTTSRSMGKSLLLVGYMEGNILSQVGQDGSGGSGVGVVIGLSVAAGEGGAGDPGGAGVASQGSSHTRWTRRIVQTKRISP